MSELLLCTVKNPVSLTTIDPDAGTIVDAIAIGAPDTAKPHEIALSLDGKRAFVSIYGNADYGRNTPDNRIAVVDLKTKRLECYIDLDLYRGPHGMVIDAVGKLWVTVEENHSVLVIDTERLEVEQTVWVQAPVHFAAADPTGRRLYFSHKEYPFITEIDAYERNVTARIELPIGAQAIHTSADGTALYVGDFNRPLLHLIDCTGRKLQRTVALRGVPGWPYPTPDGAHVVVTTWVETEGRGFIEILDASTLEARHVIEIAAEPFHALAAEDGRRLYVALGDGRLAVVDRDTGTLATTIEVGGTMPEAVVAIARPA